MNEQEWLAAFKAEFLKRTKITWNEDAGHDDSHAIERYFPDDVSEAVGQYIEKYDLTDYAVYGYADWLA